AKMRGADLPHGCRALRARPGDPFCGMNGGEMGPGSPSLRSVARDDSRVWRTFSYSIVKQQSERGPCTLLGAGFARRSFSFSVPRTRGMARRKAHVPDFAGTARITPGDPEAPGLTHQSRMRPRLSTRHCGICPLSRFSVTGLAEALQ